MADNFLPVPPPANNANIARYLASMALAQPTRVALKIPRGRTLTGDIDYLGLTFAELVAEVGAWQTRLTEAGVRNGDRTLVMVRPGLPLIAAIFALFSLGAVPVVIDPGMGLRHFLKCVAHSRPRALVGIPVARILSHLYRSAFTTVKIRVAASTSLTARLRTADTRNPESTGMVQSAPTDLAAVLFTSGSTGAPKGVCYEHGQFDAQVRLIRETYDIKPGEIDLPLLPIFALFNPALGMTTIIPELDPRRPATLDPAKIVQAIRQEKVTNSFGSPTLWGKIGAYCIEEKITLPTLRRVLCAGAPVPAALWENSRAFLPQGQLHSPYGATEALPVATISAEEIRALSDAPGESGNVTGRPETRLSGACVGRPVAGISIKIISPIDGVIESLASTVELPRGEIGEIIVHGPVVTRTYDALPEATALAKLKSQNPITETNVASGDVWHRMGDCGYLDSEGRLWFCGRKVERVETQSGVLYTEPYEQIFRGQPGVARCALIGLGARGAQEPALVIEPIAAISSAADRQRLAEKLLGLAAMQRDRARIQKIFFYPRFPVDVRHNAKIHRLALARWARTATPLMSAAKS